jgi:hypothetical protein
MSKFRKKPVVIEAMQWTGDNTSEVIDWVLAMGNRVARWHGAIYGTADVAGLLSPQYIVIDTLEGTMRADVGDWIIRGVQGEHYPCKPDIFEATYEAVEEMPQFASDGI